MQYIAKEKGKRYEVYTKEISMLVAIVHAHTKTCYKKHNDTEEIQRI